MASRDISDTKIAIVHDWLVGGGAEKVVLELHRMFPEAPIYTSYVTPEWREKLDNKVVTGWLQYFGKLRKIMVLGRIWWFTHLDLSGYDVIITSSGNGEAFGVRKNYRSLRKRLRYFFRPSPYPLPLTPPIHINYCHTPTHYYWRHYNHYMEQPGFGRFDFLARLGLKLLVGPLRRWDYRAAQRADIVLANSTHIQADIKKYYNRDSQVLFPPIDTQRFSGPAVSRNGFVTAGRLAPMKHVDILVDAANQLRLPLTVIGQGPEYERLSKRGGPTVKILGFVSDDKLKSALSSAQAFLFASYEDFGIAPVEALAAGTPVIAFKAGGALDYVIPGKTGEFFTKQSADAVVSALNTFDPKKYSNHDIKTYAEDFSIDSFHKKLTTVIKQALQ